MRPAIPAFDRREMLALAVHFAVLAMIGLVGGGWWALSRLDPLLALPGVGWAGCALVICAPAASPMRAGIIAALSSALLSLLLLAMAGTIAPWLQLVLTGMASALVASAGAGLWALSRRRMAGRRMLRRALASLTVVATGVGIANGAPALLDPLYMAAGREAARSDRPAVWLLTSLPLSGEAQSVAAMLTVRRQSSPAYAWLDNRTRLETLDVLALDGLRQGDVLVLAHPPAFTPQQLVMLDAWLRSGGTALIMADGLSSWSAIHPVGDSRNPPVTSLLGPLLSHWGLMLDAPPDLAEHMVTVIDAGQRLTLFSPGQLRLTQSAAGRDPVPAAHCRLRAHGRIADCRIGQGRALVIADADWLNAEYWAGLNRELSHTRRAQADEATSARMWQAGNMIWLLDRIDELAGQSGRAVLPVRPVWLPVRD